MSLIKAFVGHSFTSDDAELVDTFLKFFTRLEKINDRFSWVHAEAAEPRQLADKVMALIDDRNLFIGICTKKELAISPAKISKLPFTEKQIANGSDFGWKTSDWIIQEIGLAKGRGLDILLLIENGVRKPGGLQGDVEYISFDRSAPSEAFGKIIEMISALTPRTASTVAATSPQAASPQQIEVTSEEGWKIPSHSWRRPDYELAMFHFIYKRDDVEAKKIDEAFLATPEAREPEIVAVWKAHNYCYRLIFGKGGDLTALNALVLEFPNNAEIREFHARALSQFEKHLDAAAEYEMAAARTENANDRARLLGRAAAGYAREGKAALASSLINRLRQSLQTGEVEEFRFLEAIREFAEATPNLDLQIAIAERWLDVRPDDFRARFALAYIYSEANNNELALNHYLKVPSSERDSLHWNNLGVEFQHFKLPIKAVTAFRKSEEMDQTLAMANLGFKMLSAGLSDEARAICDKALAIPDYHKNVGLLLVRLTEAVAEENKTFEEVIEKSRPKVEFFRGFGRALTLAKPPNIEGAWESPECPMNVTIVDDKIEITGNYDKPVNALSLGILGALTSTQKVRQHVEHFGTFEGRAIIARVKRSDEGSTGSASLLSLSGDGKTLMYISDDGSDIHVSENPSGIFPKNFVMKRQAATPASPLSIEATPSPNEVLFARESR